MSKKKLTAVEKARLMKILLKTKNKRLALKIWKTLQSN